MKRALVFLLAFFSLAMQNPPIPGRVDVTWRRSVTPGVDHYNVYYKKTSAGGTGRVKHLANRAACTLDLPSGIAYTVWATALKNGFESDPSNIIQVIAP